MTQESGILDRWRINLQSVTQSKGDAFKAGPHGPAACLLISLAHRVLLRCLRHSLTENRIRLSLRPASFSQSKRSSSASR